MLRHSYKSRVDTEECRHDVSRSGKTKEDKHRHFEIIFEKIEDPFPSTNKAYCTYITSCGCTTVWH